MPPLGFRTWILFFGLRGSMFGDLRFGVDDLNPNLGSCNVGTGSKFFPWAFIWVLEYMHPNILGLWGARVS